MKKIWKTCILLCAVMMVMASCAKKETPAANTLTAEQQAAKEKFIAKLTALKAQGDKQQAADSLRADTVARLLSPAKTVKDTLAVLKSIAVAKNVSNQVAVQKTETVAQPSSL